MNSFLRKLLGMNWLLAIIAVALAIFGVICIYSVTFMREEAYLQEMWRRQIVWLVIAVVGFFVTSFINYRIWLSNVIFPLLLYLAGLGFLVLTHFFGRTTYGAKSWLEIGPISSLSLPPCSCFPGCSLTPGTGRGFGPPLAVLPAALRSSRLPGYSS